MASHTFRSWKSWVIDFARFAGIVFAIMKIKFTYQWWFDGATFWAHAWRPIENPDYGALLGAKWIGTRNLELGLGVFAVSILKNYKGMALIFLMGTLVEFFDGFWLAYGKYVAGWVGPRTDYYMYGGFAWVPPLLIAGLFLLVTPSEDLKRERVAPDPIIVIAAILASYFLFWALPKLIYG